MVSTQFDNNQTLARYSHISSHCFIVWFMFGSLSRISHQQLFLCTLSPVLLLMIHFFFSFWSPLAFEFFFCLYVHSLVPSIDEYFCSKTLSMFTFFIDIDWYCVLCMLYVWCMRIRCTIEWHRLHGLNNEHCPNNTTTMIKRNIPTRSRRKFEYRIPICEWFESTMHWPLYDSKNRNPEIWCVCQLWLNICSTTENWICDVCSLS